MNARVLKLLAFAPVWAGLPACQGATVTATQVMVEIEAAPGVRAATQHVRVTVLAGQGAMNGWEDRYDKNLPANTARAWPVEISLLPKNDDASRVYEVTAIALDADGNPTATVRAISGFLPHQALKLVLRFDDGCLGKAELCAETESCRDGGCKNAHVDVGSLVAYVPSDTGKATASMTDAGSMISVGMDAGGDGSAVQAVGSSHNASDGGLGSNHPDAASDAGSDAAGPNGQSDAAVGTFPFTPANFDPSAIDFGAMPSTTLDCEATTTIDTTDSVTITNWCGTAPAPVVQSQGGGPDVVVLPLQTLTIASSTTLRVIGTKPLILAVRGDVVVNGTIDARGTGATPGAGGNACAIGRGGNGSSDANNNEGAGGGGGAGFGAAGGGGGKGDRTNGSTAGGAAGATEGGTNLVPLRGGCQGGSGGKGGGTGGAGGGGGGAIEISSGSTITLGSTAVITASAGAGSAGSAPRDGGGGGGSGGAILLEAHVVTVSSGAWLTANGGGGASGYPNATNGSATAGSDGSTNSGSQATGPGGNNGGGGGGKGAASSGGATAGGDGTCTGGILTCPLGGTYGAGGGGGGGAFGRTRVHSVSSCTLSGTFSPMASAACP